ncbi:MAG: hypothetical protein GX629_09735 [Phycisphaerae bacterium]|jgi:hypothetical protein|nr:hypothetical protein [Phycisphaerae bacterium]
MNYNDPDQIIDILDQASIQNRLDPLREGHMLNLPNYGQVVMTGDLHGCIHNFKKLQWLADLERVVHRHVIVHELIHANGNSNADGDDSLLLLIQAARWKIDYPDQVHFLMGNHDLAQLTDREISKGGAASIANFNKWIADRFGESAARKILTKINEFLLSLPLAARSPNRIWFSHSLPGTHAMDYFDFSLFSRDWEAADYVPKGSLYELLWGRNHTAEQLAELAGLLNIDFFILGHQRKEQGYDLQYEKLIILASDHNLGCFLPIDLARRYTFKELAERIKFFYELPDLPD